MEKDFVEMEAQIFNYECWLGVTDKDKLKLGLQELLIKAGFSIVNFVEHNFPVKGYTCVWVLAESHLAIHTFPDQNKSYLQISSCNSSKLNLFKKMLAQLFIDFE